MDKYVPPGKRHQATHERQPEKKDNKKDETTNEMDHDGNVEINAGTLLAGEELTAADIQNEMNQLRVEISWLETSPDQYAVGDIF